MLEAMTASEYVHWQAFFSVEPFPQTQADIRAAKQMLVTYYAAGAKNLKLQDYMPDWWGEQTDWQTPEQIKANMKFIKASRKKTNAS